MIRVLPCPILSSDGLSTMKPVRLLDRATTPAGTPLTLHEHDGTILIRVGSVELMSTRQYHSEEMLAALACAGLEDRPRAAVLIGGLGLGFTLRETLQHVAADARVVVAELVPAVIAWNRNPAYGLAADVIDDPRVEVIAGDVGDVLRDSRSRFDAIMLDVDNGASGLTTAGNDGLYQAAGLGLARAALKPGGRLAVWSAEADPRFKVRMEEAGFAVEVTKTRTHPTGGSWNWILVGTRS
jgi:spermidine synthase